MKVTKISSIISLGMLIIMTSCFGSKAFLVTSGSENLRSLTKITDGENTCMYPGGSVDSTMLFFAMTINGSTSIYRKEKPTAPAQVQLTSGNSCTFPTYCAATDRIAFSREINGFYDIYMLAVTKANALIPITETNRENEIVPSISPDGTCVAYQKGNLNSIDAEIWVKNIATGENMLLGKGSTPSISPDGKRIAYAKIESNNSRNIWVMDIDGSNAQQLTVSKEEFAGFPKWSPSGHKIVFQSNKKKGNFDIFVMNNNGTGLVQLTTNESEDLAPFWSKEGYIYFTSDRGDKKNHYNIWRFYYED